MTSFEPSSPIESHRPDPEDHFQFVIRPDPVHPTITGDGVKYDGYRYKVNITLAGKTYVDFGLDVAFGDPIFGEPELLHGSDFFEKVRDPRDHSADVTRALTPR